MESGKLMGIINLTDNSFFSPSRVDFNNPVEVVKKAQTLFEDGADIIDIGACSTAPGTTPVSPEQEWQRLEAPLRALFEAFPNAQFSIDSFRPEIVRKVLEIKGCPGDIIINDVEAAKMNVAMLRLIADSGVRYVAMDSGNDPVAFFDEFSSAAETYGLKDWILDPGFGFGKSVERNWEILQNLGELKRFGRPILAALSHKRMIYVPLGLTPETCSSQSVDAEKLAFALGADIVRTHDIKAHRCRISQ